MLPNLFGKKPPHPQKKFFPQNRLEALLMQAAKEPGAEPEFLRELMSADLYVLVVPKQNQTGRFTAEPGDTIQIKGITIKDRQVIPVFTSELRLREYIREQEIQAKLNGNALFSMIAQQQDGILLNPASSYGKEFTYEEVVSLADGSIFQPVRHTVEKETQVLLGMPAQTPEKTLNAIRSYLAGRAEVKRAHYAQIHIPASGEPPHLLFAFEVDGDFAPIASELNVIFRSTLAAGESADLVVLGQGGGLDEYFNDQEPFYKK